MKSRAALSVILLLLSFMAYGLDQPVKLWEKWYYSSYDNCHFRDMELTPNGNLFITGGAWDWTQPIQEQYIAWLFDLDGSIIWKIVKPFYGFSAYDGTVLQDGSFALTGQATAHEDSSYSLSIVKLTCDGEVEWIKVYDYPDTKEEGYGITCLPDGGFAVCGRVHGTGSHGGQAWLLRTDSYGDTLWTKTWESSSSWGKAVLFNNNELCVLANGATDSLPTRGSHLLFYDLDGNYLYGSDYPNLYLYEPGDLCEASDGGVTFATNTLPVIWHTNQFGETLWWHNIPEPFGSGTNHEGFCIRRTMDSGFVFSGWGGETPEWDERFSTEFRNTENNETYDTQDGWLARYDSDGELLWTFQNCTATTNHFYSVVQLPQGGYMACGTWGGTWGGSGYLVRYAPETGIEQPESTSTLRMDISPNPFSSLLSVSFSLPEAGNAWIRIFDLSGRLVSTVADGQFPAGTNSAEWAVPEDVSSGCYLIQYNYANRTLTNTIALIK